MKKGTYHHSPATIEKIRQALKGRLVSEEHRKNNSLAHQGHIPSSATREKLRRAKQGENHPNFGKPGYNTGNKYSDEIKAKISKAARGRILGPLSDETKKKISESNMGKHSKCKSDETKKRISEAQCGIPWSETRRSAQNKRDLDSKSLFKRISTSLLLDTDFTG